MLLLIANLKAEHGFLRSQWDLIVGRKLKYSTITMLSCSIRNKSRPPFLRDKIDKSLLWSMQSGGAH